MITAKRELTAKFLGRLSGKRKVKGIILHDTAGSGTHGDTKYLADPSGDGRKVSVDFTVERDGKVYQLNPDLEHNYTYHAGRATSFKGLSNQDVTRYCIGIEIVQKAKMSLIPKWPVEQVKAVAILCAQLCETFKLDKSDITTHARIITDGSRSDPRDWPFAQFWALFNDYSSRRTTTSGVLLSEAVSHHVKNGDTLYGIARQYATTIEKLKALNGMESPSTNIYVGQTLLVKE